MTDFITNLAARAGIDAGMAQKGMGALLSALQRHVPAEAYSKVASAIPDAGKIVSEFQPAPTGAQDSSLDLAKLAGGFLGEWPGAIPMLVSQLSRAGFTTDGAQAFLPVAFSFLKDKISPDTAKQIEDAVPGLSPLLSKSKTGEGSGLAGDIKKLLSK